MSMRAAGNELLVPAAKKSWHRCGGWLLESSTCRLALGYLLVVEIICEQTVFKEELQFPQASGNLLLRELGLPNHGVRSGDRRISLGCGRRAGPRDAFGRRLR